MEDGKLLEILNSYNRFWTTGRIDTGIPRDLLGRCIRQLDKKEAVLLKGVRRSGKSTLMAQMIGALLENGKKPTQVLRINLEEPLFAAEYSIELLERIYRLYREKLHPSGRCYLFLDEIQNIPEWERWVRGRGETENLKIVITGSSSRLLSREVGAKLTGRHVSFELFPLSFAEFLRFKGVQVGSIESYFEQKPVIRSFFAEYRKYGGFPEVVLRHETEDKELLLKQYFEDILHRDVVSRTEIRDTLTLQNLAVFLMSNIGRLTSVSNLKKNFGVSQDKVENYASALIESYLLYRLPKLEPSIKKSIRARFKPYAIDTGLRNRVAFSFSEDSGWLAENIVLNHLRSRHEEIYYESNGGEVDFVVKEGMKIARSIQIWHADAAETAIPEREFAAFKTRGKVAEKRDCLVITNDLSRTMKVGGNQIQCVPLVLFLLDLP
ncbi:MAG TPA: ATP-binding protein [Desulfobacterales bacterium]|nr:ATP-binding protein [Desulfobacterales bacterium]